MSELSIQMGFTDEKYTTVAKLLSAKTSRRFNI